jgi:SAM-dependent methyltransferase
MPVSNLQEIAPNLELNPGGWWETSESSEVSYPEEGNALCFLVEDSSFWFRHRNRCILEILRLFPPPGTFFDVGGGNGYVARAIQDTGLEVVLIEPGIDGVRNALRRGVRQVVRGTLEAAGIPGGVLPAVGLFDVVEHIADDYAFMAGINRALIPEGRVYVTVPACEWLWSDEDAIAGHSRRYTIPTLRALLRGSGFEVEFATYFFGYLPLPILLQRAIPYRFGRRAEVTEEGARSDHEIGNPLVDQILEGLSRWELSRLARRRSVRGGGSCLVVARNTSGK